MSILNMALLSFASGPFLGVEDGGRIEKAGRPDPATTALSLDTPCPGMWWLPLWLRGLS